MSEGTSVNTIARERVDNLAARNAEPQSLKNSRLAAWEAYLQTPMPTGRDQEWRGTEIDSLDLSALHAIDISSTSNDSKILPKWLDETLKHFPKRAQVVGEVGLISYNPELPKELTQKGVVFCTLKHALQNHAQLVAPKLERAISSESDGKFGLMNKALFNSGVFLYVPPNTEIEEHFLSIIDFAADNQEPHAKGLAIFPRIIVVLGANSSASLVNIFSSSSAFEGKNSNQKAQATSLFNSLVEVYVSDGAKLRYVEVQKFGPSVFAVSKTQSEVGKDGLFNSLTAGLGGAQLKSEIKTTLSARGAASDVQGVVLGDGSERFSFNTIQDHDAPDTRSNINFRVALKERSSSVYQGIIKVAKAAQKTDAFQSNKNLLLGNEARADSIPKLEILADDVKCSHGATVGPVDRDQVFYLMSRGLTATEAEELIVAGFFRQVLETCPIQGAIEWINELVTDKIHGA